MTVENGYVHKRVYSTPPGPARRGTSLRAGRSTWSERGSPAHQCGPGCTFGQQRYPWGSDGPGAGSAWPHPAPRQRPSGTTALGTPSPAAVSHCQRDRYSAAPPSPFGRCFKCRDGEVSKTTASPMPCVPMAIHLHAPRFHLPPDYV